MFSPGLDLKYVGKLKHINDARYFYLEFISLYGRILSLSIPSICLIKGPAIAGGGMFAFSHDLIYAKDSALLAFNEVTIGLHLPPGMM